MLPTPLVVMCLLEGSLRSVSTNIHPLSRPVYIVVLDDSFNDISYSQGSVRCTEDCESRRRFEATEDSYSMEATRDAEVECLFRPCTLNESVFGCSGRTINWAYHKYYGLNQQSAFRGVQVQSVSRSWLSSAAGLLRFGEQGCLEAAHELFFSCTNLSRISYSRCAKGGFEDGRC